MHFAVIDATPNPPYDQHAAVAFRDTAMRRYLRPTEIVVLLPGEVDLPEIHPAPLPVVVAALRTYRTWDALAEHLPDLEIGEA